MLKLFQNKYRIKSARLKGWDYSNEGGYYVTICTKDRELFFGDIKNGKMILNDVGKIVQNEWLKTGEIRKNVLLDEFIVMPNHAHGIIIIRANGTAKPRRHVETLRRNVSTWTTQKNQTTPNSNNHKYTGKFPQMSKISPKPKSLSAIIRCYKSQVTKWCNQNNYPYFQWQSRFHDSIIRNQQSLNKIQNYIKNNPIKWELDKNNPINFNPC